MFGASIVAMVQTYITHDIEQVAQDDTGLVPTRRRKIERRCCKSEDQRMVSRLIAWIGKRNGKKQEKVEAAGNM